MIEKIIVIYFLGVIVALVIHVILKAMYNIYAAACKSVNKKPDTDYEPFGANVIWLSWLIVALYIGAVLAVVLTGILTKK